MERKRKLAYIVHGLGVGGAEIALLSALPLLHEQFDLRVYMLGKSKQELVSGLNPDIKQRMKFYNFGVYALPFYVPVIYAAIRSFNPDLMISSLWRSSIVAMLYKSFHRRHVKYFILLHSSGFFHAADRFFTKMGMHASDAIFVDSRATEQFVKHVVGEEMRIQVLSYLVTPSMTQRIKHKFIARKKLLFVGRLNPVKRVPLVVKAVAWLREKGVDATLHIYGRDDGDRANVEREIRNYRLVEYVSFEGEIDPADKHQVFASYSYYIQLSAQEGMAMSVAEAMQHGAVCIVTPVGGIAQYARDGQSAIFVDTSNEQTWDASMQKIQQVLDDPERCAAISNAAFDTFKGMPVFADSLIEAINHYVA